MNTEFSAGKFWTPIIQAYLDGHTALPSYMGLEPEGFSLVCHYFQITPPAAFSHQHPQRLLLSDLVGLRQSERQDLITLLNQYRNPEDSFSSQMTTVLSFACLGTQHLWHDIGMPERPLLTQLFGFTIRSYGR